MLNFAKMPRKFFHKYSLNFIYHHHPCHAKLTKLSATFAEIFFELKLLVQTNGLYYKTITIVIMMIVSDATVWSITYDHN